MNTNKRKGATKHCSFGTCKSDSRYPDKPEMDSVFFIRFPQRHREPEKCRLWANACGRKHFGEECVKKDTYICSVHFVGGKGPTDDHPNPIPATATKFDIERIQKARPTRIRRQLAFVKNVSIQNQENIVSSCDAKEAAEILLSLQTAENAPIACDPLNKGERKRTMAFDDACLLQPSPKRPCLRETDTNRVQKASGTVDQETQTSAINMTLKQAIAMKVENHELKMKLQENENFALKNSKTFSINDIKDDNEKMHFYTGLIFSQFLCLWKFLGPAVNNLSRVSNPRKNENTPSKSRGPKRKLSPQNELLLTLVRLRLGLLHQDLAYRFGISVATVNDIITTWIQFMYLQFNRLRTHMFPPRSKLRKHLPKSFKKFKNVRVILDATEFFTEAPRNYEQQGNMYSSYKNHCTCKSLIGISPSGAISFISDVYEGAISDKEIFVNSNILNMLDPGDLVMVDRGFNVRDLLLDKGADIVIPPFLGGREKLTPQEEAQTKVIAKLRIHVERVIERMKKFKILKKVVPLNTLPTFSQTVFIVACLVNFQKPIVN